ncbi:MAG: hypothetical protein U5K37_08820 [Natrialbaceae archaeon]|nr:hypothetical protein [Natrialbaceae archaeon]
MGGLIGSISPNDDIVSVETSYATGHVGAADLTGGLVGEVQTGNLENVSFTDDYWDVDSTNQSEGVGNVSVTGITGLTTDQMQGESATTHMAGYDFQSVWSTRTVPDDYPILRLADSTVQSITLSVANDTLVTGEQTTATVTAHTDAGTTQTVTSAAALSSSNGSVLSVTDAGTVTAEGAGQATVTATYENVSDSTAVAVADDELEAIPETYYGTLTINGQPAPANTTVEGIIDGEVRGTATVTVAGEYGSEDPFGALLAVSGTEDDTGATVGFRVIPPDSSSLAYGMANQSGTFTPNASTELNLTATLETAQAPHYNLTLSNDGTPYPIGWPGPVNGSIIDALPNGTDGISAIYRYTTDGWVQVNDPDYTPAPLEGLVIVTSGEGPARHPGSGAIAERDDTRKCNA